MPAGITDPPVCEVEVASVSLRSCVQTAAALSLVTGVMQTLLILPMAINEKIPVATAEGEMIRAFGYHVIYVVPLLHIVLAIVFAALAAILYNLAAGRFGGIVVRTGRGIVTEGTWAIREIGVFPAMKIGICLSLALMTLETLIYECVGWMGTFVWPLSWTPILYGSGPDFILFTVTVWILAAVACGILVGGVGSVLYDLVAVILGGVRVTTRSPAKDSLQDTETFSENKVEMEAVVPRSAARALGVIGLGMGFMIGIVTLVQNSGIEGTTPAVVAAALLIGIVLYGIAGCAGGYVIAVLYNLIARIVGGATFVLEKTEDRAFHPSG